MPTASLFVHSSSIDTDVVWVYVRTADENRRIISPTLSTRAHTSGYSIRNSEIECVLPTQRRGRTDGHENFVSPISPGPKFNAAHFVRVSVWMLLTFPPSLFRLPHSQLSCVLRPQQLAANFGRWFSDPTAGIITRIKKRKTNRQFSQIFDLEKGQWIKGEIIKNCRRNLWPNRKSIETSHIYTEQNFFSLNNKFP
jgi:hypothetical protein